MLTTWRLVHVDYVEGAFDGESTARFGSRWTSPGLSVVYVAGTLALAVLERLVHMAGRDKEPDYVSIECSFPEDFVSAIGFNELPPDWRETPAPKELREDIGNRWLRSLRSAVLSVPSVIVPFERNYILNPAHPDFAKIRIGKPEPFAFDIRLLNRYNPPP